MAPRHLQILTCISNAKYDTHIGKKFRISYKEIKILPYLNKQNYFQIDLLDILKRCLLNFKINKSNPKILSVYLNILLKNKILHTTILDT